MCLGIPGQITRIVDSTNQIAMVVVSGVERKINVTCVAEPGKPLESLVGAWVLMHVGFAMSVIDEAEARKTLEVIDAMGELQDELAAMREDALSLDRRP